LYKFRVSFFVRTFCTFQQKVDFKPLFCKCFLFNPRLLITRSAVRARPGEPITLFSFPLQNRNLRDYARAAGSRQFVLSNADCDRFVTVLWQFLFPILNFLLYVFEREQKTQSKHFVYFYAANVYHSRSSPRYQPGSR